MAQDFWSLTWLGSRNIPGLLGISAAVLGSFQMFEIALADLGLVALFEV